MELKQYLIHRKYQKGSAKNQITIGEDYSLPEGKPDIAEILQNKAEIQMEEVHTEKGKIRVRGTLKLWVLYLAERSQETAASLSMEFPFDEILYMEGASNGDNLKIGWSIEDLRVTIIHPGKLGIRTVVTLHGVITASEDQMITENMEGEGQVFTKTETFTMAESVLDQKESYRVRDEVVLPVNKPNVHNVLWKELQLRGMDIRIQEGRLALKGEVLFFAVYQGEDEQSEIQWLEQSVPFHGTLDVAGITPEMFGMLEAEVAHQDIELKPDYDGEMRMFQLEMLIDLHIHLYEERSCRRLIDAYSTKEQLNLQSQEVCYEKLRMCNFAKCRVDGQGRVDEDTRILQIVGHQARLQNTNAKASDQGILWEGSLEVQVLYITANDRQPLGSVTVVIPCSQLIDIPEMSKEDQWKVSEMVEQILISMPDGGHIEVRGVIGLNSCVMEQCRFHNVSEIGKESYDLEEYKNRPGIMIHFVQPKETLWEIAKENRTTMEEIKKRNDLTTEEVVPGQKLLLLKQSADSIFS